ncbi:hypothetical protein [Bradyrhizobium algeriense]|uniref:hypothetical protein n=1 Tax=Bradyrhizobium algeriense TaxID=634784 RepID=UPI000D3769B1|nr:hypothetical protein [Bradyrhizobium algeriense]
MRPAKKGRIGTIMVTPAKLPVNDSPSPLMRTAIVSTGLLAFGTVVALSLPAPRSGTTQPEAASPDRAETLDPPFQDRPGACKLIETAVSRGDPTMAQRLANCRAN